jgi:protein translocase SEC61 complex gamma subunit
MIIARNRANLTCPRHHAFCRLLNRCEKPDRKEFLKVARLTSVGFLAVGFLGFFVKLIFIPINQVGHSGVSLGGKLCPLNVLYDICGCSAPYEMTSSQPKFPLRCENLSSADHRLDPVHVYVKFKRALGQTKPGPKT